MTDPLFLIVSSIICEPLKTKKIFLSTPLQDEFILNDRLETSNQVFMFFTNNLNRNIEQINLSDNKHPKGEILKEEEDEIVFNKGKYTNSSNKTIKLRSIESVYPLFYKNKRTSRYKTDDTLIVFDPFDSIELVTLGLTAKYQRTMFINSNIRQIYECEDIKTSTNIKKFKMTVIVDIAPPLSLINKENALLDDFNPVKTRLVSFEEENDEYKLCISSNLYFEVIEEENLFVGFVYNTENKQDEVKIDIKNEKKYNDENGNDDNQASNKGAKLLEL